MPALPRAKRRTQIQRPVGISHQMRRRRGIRGGEKAAPNRKRARTDDASSSVSLDYSPISSQSLIFQDPNHTPRARQNQGTTQAFSDQYAAVSTASTTSTNPSNCFGKTEFSNFPISEKILIEGDLPPALKTLCRDMSDIAPCVAIIPPAAQVYLEQHESFRAHNAAASEDKDQVYEDSLSPESFLERACDIWRNSGECHDEDTPEAAWNGEVHCQLLRLALRGKCRAHGVWYKDITSVRLTDKSLLPVSGVFPSESKLVDYDIFLEPDQSLRAQIVEKLARCDDTSYSINASSSEWIRFFPLAISIQTKRGGDSR